MSEREEELKARVREAPLTDRLSECRKRIGKMCAEGRAPRMCIPVQHDDDDFFICTTLADAQATVEALQRERDEWRSNAVAQEARANDLERDCKDLQSGIEDERAKVKGLHEITKVICTHCCEPMEIPSKAVLQTQLTQLQALVRVAKAEVWKEAAVKYALWVGEDSEVPADPHLDGYERFEDYCHDRATLDATTPAVGGHE